MRTIELRGRTLSQYKYLGAKNPLEHKTVQNVRKLPSVCDSHAAGMQTHRAVRPHSELTSGPSSLYGAHTCQGLRLRAQYHTAAANRQKQRQIPRKWD